MNLLGHVVARTRKREIQEWKVIRKPVPEYIPLTEPERKFYNLVTKTVRDFCEKQNYFEGFLLVTPQRQMFSSMPASLQYWQQKKNIFQLKIYMRILVLIIVIKEKSAHLHLN